MCVCLLMNVENSVRAFVEEVRAAGWSHFRLHDVAVYAGMLPPEAELVPSATVHAIAPQLEAMGCTPTRRYVDGEQIRVWLMP